MATRGRETYTGEQNRITLASVTVLRGGGHTPHQTALGGGGQLAWPSLVSRPHFSCPPEKIVWA